MKMSHNLSIQCLEQWMRMILECQHLEVNRNRIKINISINLLLKREVSLELPTLMPMLIQRESLKLRLLIHIELKSKDQDQHSNRAMITSIRKALHMLMRKAESKFLLISKHRAKGHSGQLHQLMDSTSSRSQISNLTKMRWVQSWWMISRHKTRAKDRWLTSSMFLNTDHRSVKLQVDKVRMKAFLLKRRVALTPDQLSTADKLDLEPRPARRLGIDQPRRRPQPLIVQE